MDLYYKQEVTVGLLVLAGVGLLVGGLLWLTGRSLGTQGRVPVEARFASVSGLTVGDPVHISGVDVGRVAFVQLLPSQRVRVRFEVRRDVRPRTDASVAVRSLDFLGAKFLDYSPGTIEAWLPDTAVIEGHSEEGDLATSALQLAEQANRTLLRTQELITGQLTSQVERTLVATERAMTVLARIGGGPMVGEATGAITSLHSAAARLDSTLGNPAIERSVSQMDEITVAVQEMTEGLAVVTTTLGSLLQQMESGNGTVGKALSDPTLHNDLHETLQALRLLLEDLRENPGRYLNVKVF